MAAWSSSSISNISITIIISVISSMIIMLIIISSIIVVFKLDPPHEWHRCHFVFVKLELGRRIACGMDEYKCSTLFSITSH